MPQAGPTIRAAGALRCPQRHGGFAKGAVALARAVGEPAVRTGAVGATRGRRGEVGAGGGPCLRSTVAAAMPSPPPGCSRPETRSGASSPGTAEDADARSGALGGRTVAAVGPLPPSPRGTRLAGERAGSVPAPEEEMRALMAEVDVRVAPASRGSTLALANLSGHPAIAVPNGFVDEDSPPQHHLRGAPPGRGGPPRRGLRVPGGHRLPPEAPAAVRPVRWNGAAHPRGSRPGAAPRDRGRPGSAARARPGGRGRAHRWAGRGAGWPGAWAAPAGPGRCMACRPGSKGRAGGWAGDGRARR
jgi:hypothetical protein